MNHNGVDLTNKRFELATFWQSAVLSASCIRKMSMFKYAPISRDVPSIRLLKLFRAPADTKSGDESGIKCEFELTHLDDDRYDAVSYT